MIIRKCDCCHKELGTNGYYDLKIKLQSPVRYLNDLPDTSYDLCADCALYIHKIINSKEDKEMMKE